jgi:bifunctional DNase/RNase
VDEDLISLKVTDVSLAVPAGNGVEAGLVVLREDQAPYRVLRMYVGRPEARAIRVAWKNEVPPRPSTWDLFVSTMALLGGRIERAVINDHEEGRHFFAQITVHKDDEPLILTARPSDAIALALRSYGAVIYARPHVLLEAGVLTDDPPPEANTDVQTLIDRLVGDTSDRPPAAVPPPLASFAEAPGGGETPASGGDAAATSVPAPGEADRAGEADPAGEVEPAPHPASAWAFPLRSAPAEDAEEAPAEDAAPARRAAPRRRAANTPAQAGVAKAGVAKAGVAKKKTPVRPAAAREKAPAQPASARKQPAPPVAKKGAPAGKMAPAEKAAPVGAPAAGPVKKAAAQRGKPPRA